MENETMVMEVENTEVAEVEATQEDGFSAGDAAGLGIALAGIAAIGYGVYKGGKWIYGKTAPKLAEMKEARAAKKAAKLKVVEAESFEEIEDEEAE